MLTYYSYKYTQPKAVDPFLQCISFPPSPPFHPFPHCQIIENDTIPCASSTVSSLESHCEPTAEAGGKNSLSGEVLCPEDAGGGGGDGGAGGLLGLSGVGSTGVGGNGTVLLGGRGEAVVGDGGGGHGSCAAGDPTSIMNTTGTSSCRSEFEAPASSSQRADRPISDLGTSASSHPHPGTADTGNKRTRFSLSADQVSNGF